jgi:hypothetical protein
MIPSYRQDFNARFTPEKIRATASRNGLTLRHGSPVRALRDPVLLPDELVVRMSEDGKALIRQLVENPEYRTRSDASIPPKFRVPNESPPSDVLFR